MSAPCPNCGATDPESRMGHEVRGVYDGILFWSCLDCDFAWPRDFAMPSRAKAATEAANAHMGVA